MNIAKNNIIILSTPRSGSNYVANIISRVKEHHRPKASIIHEPFKKKEILHDKLQEMFNAMHFDNLVLRCHAFDVLGYWGRLKYYHGENTITVSVNRRSMYEKFLSLVIAKKIGMWNIYGWNQEYKTLYDRKYNISFEDFKTAFVDTIKYEIFLRKFSCDINVWYEDLTFDQETDLRMMGFNDDVSDIELKTTLKLANKSEKESLIYNFDQLQSWWVNYAEDLKILGFSDM